MANFEAMLAQLDVGEQEAVQTEVKRQDRYKLEDELTARVRANEDALRIQGIAYRETVRAQINAAIVERENTPLKRTGDRLNALQARIDALEALLSKAVTDPTPEVKREVAAVEAAPVAPQA